MGDEGSEPIRVLHVDDDPAFAELVADALDGEGISVVTATGYEAGVERFRSGEFDCVVSDFEMPSGDGFDLLEAVRDVAPDVPFILFTGRGSEEVASEAISRGVTDYLQKRGGTEQFEVLENRIRNAVERVRVERDLRRAESRYRRLVEQNLVGIYVIQDGEYAYVNPKLGEIFGYDHREMVGMSALAVVAEEDRDRVEENLERRRTGDVEDLEYRFTGVRKDGERIVAEVHGGRIHHDGEPAIMGTLVDVTDQVERERRLEAERDRRSALFENAGDAIVETRTVETTPTIRAVNPAFVETFGYDPEEVIGRPIGEVVVPPGEMDDFERIKEQVVAGEIVETEVRRRTASGVRDFLLRGAPIELGEEGTASYAIYTDITERKERERAFERLHRATRELIHADTAEAAARVTADAAKDVLGYRDNVVRLHDGASGTLEPAAVTDELRERLGERPVYRVGEGTVGRAFEADEPLVYDDLSDLEDGYDREGIRSGMYLPIGGHGVLSIADPDPGVFDESDVQIASVLAANAESVLDRIRREEALRDRESQLERQNRHLDEFASLLSHDLRNPLNVAQGNLQVYRETGDEELLDRIETAHDRMDHLVGDALTLARHGDAVTETEPVDLPRIARDAWSTVETDGLDLEVALSARVDADPGRLRQLFENLFRNASEHGGSTVRVGALAEGFYVEDDGPGVPPGERDRVFELGYSSDELGTGLGLTIVRRIAEAHGWSVAVAEGPDGGARFEIRGVDLA